MNTEPREHSWFFLNNHSHFPASYKSKSSRNTHFHSPSPQKWPVNTKNKTTPSGETFKTLNQISFCILNEYKVKKIKNSQSQSNSHTGSTRVLRLKCEEAAFIKCLGLKKHQGRSRRSWKLPICLLLNIWGANLSGINLLPDTFTETLGREALES